MADRDRRGMFADRLEALTEMMVAAVEGGDRASNAVSNGSDLWKTPI